MTIDRLQVMWIDDERRGGHAVGELRREGGKYYFEYGDVSEAAKHGFMPLPEFSDLSRTYASERLFSTFAERIPSTRRSDRVRILRGLRLLEPADDFDILARSGGALATDRVELVEQREVGDLFERPLIFRIAGTRHHPQGTPLLENERLSIVLDPANPYDASACGLERADGTLAGYVPHAYSKAVAYAQARGALSVRVLRSIPDPHRGEPRWMAMLSSSEPEL